MKRVILHLFTVIFLVAPWAAQAQSVTPVAIPMHGNWCGPGHPANPWQSAPPVDPLDDACMRHDYCIAVRGPLDCGCDLQFLQEIRYTQWPPIFHTKARAIYDALAMMPCSDPVGTLQKQTLWMEDWISDLQSGRSSPEDLMFRLGYLGLHSMDRMLTDGSFR